MSALTKFFDTIRPLSNGISYEVYSNIIKAATDLSTESYMQGYDEAKANYGRKDTTPESIVNNTPETHSMNVL